MRKIHVAYFHFKTSPAKIVERLVGLGVDARLVYYNGDLLVKTANDDFLVNWGYAGRVWKTHMCADINNRNTVENKYIQKVKIINAGVPSPRLFPIDKGFPGVPVVLRDSVSHHGGAGALYVSTKAKWDERIKEFTHGYCMEFIDKTREFRVHANRDGFLYVTERMPKDHNRLIWNWASEKVSTDDAANKACANVAIRAIHALGYDFGGVDVMMTADGKVFVTEANTAPALETKFAVDKYAKYIIQRAGL